MLQLDQNYNIFCEIGLEVENGIIKDQDTGDMIKNYATGKYLIEYIPGTKVHWGCYEDFDPCHNFKQLKVLTEYYLNKLKFTEDRYFETFCTDMKNDKICVLAKSNSEEVRSDYFDKDKAYLAYIDFIFKLSGINEDMSFYIINKDEENGGQNVK